MKDGRRHEIHLLSLNRKNEVATKPASLRGCPTGVPVFQSGRLYKLAANQNFENRNHSITKSALPMAMQI